MKEKGLPWYSESYWYNCPEQLSLKDKIVEHGLCSNCERWGVRIWVELDNLLVTIFEDEQKLKKMRKELKALRLYFERSGLYYRNLKMESEVADWDVSYGVSDPNVEAFCATGMVTRMICYEFTFSSRLIKIKKT